MSNAIIGWGAAFIALVAAGIMFGMQGILVLLFLGLFFILPFYIAYSAFGFRDDEAFFFGGFTGIAFFPLLLWYLGLILGSFRAGMVSAFILAMVVSTSLYYWKKKSFPFVKSLWPSTPQNKSV